MSQQPMYGPRYGMDCYGMAARYGSYVPAPMIPVPVPYFPMNPSVYAVPPQPVNVPTAQLIEVEPSPMPMGPMAPNHPQAALIGPTYSQHAPVPHVGSPMAPATRAVHSPWYDILNYFFK